MYIKPVVVMDLFVFVLITMQGIKSPTAKGACTLPTTCHFNGWWENTTYRFNVGDLDGELKCCKIVVYGSYEFGVKDANNHSIYMPNPDIEALKSLSKKSKTVYVIIRTHDWVTMLEPGNEEVVDIELSELKKFAQEHKITGVVMEHRGSFIPSSPFTDKNVVSFTNKIKNKCNLKVGITLTGIDYTHFPKTAGGFDFEALNAAVDHYYVDMTLSNVCNAQGKVNSVNPISSNDYKILTFENMCVAISESAMDKCKVYATLQVETVKSTDNPTENVDSLGSYTQLCTDYKKNPNVVKWWCSDPSKLLYDQGNFVRNYVSGLMLSFIEGDDYSGTCGCPQGRYPVANLIMSGWDNATLQECAKIDEIDAKVK